MRLIYKLLIVSFMMLFALSCNNDEKSLENKVQDLRNKLSYPFSEASKVEIFSYKSKFDAENSFSDFLEQNISKSKRTKAVFDNNQLNINERIALTPDQVVALSQILYNQPCGDEIVGNCFTPRHAIVFYDKEGDPFAYSEICLECANASNSTGFTKFQLCNAKVDSLTKFFSSVGINYYHEPIL